MNKTLLIMGMFLLFVVASENQVFAQIQDIKKEAEENKKKKEEPKKTPVRQPVSQPVVEQSQPVTVIPAVEEITFLPVPVNRETPSVSSDDYEFDFELLELGCLIPACIINRSSDDEDCLHKIDSSFLSIELRGQVDIGYHPSPYWHFMYVDYLPGVRVNLEYFMFDFRYNILTEYTDDYPDSFTSWELMLLFNLIPQRNFKLFIGTGIHNEEFTDTKYNEHCLGAKYNLNEHKDYIDADIRLSVDYKTKAFPFFEGGVRYNKLFLSQKRLVGHVSLGTVYQNYYQSHDIWSIRGGVVINIHY